MPRKEDPKKDLPAVTTDIELEQNFLAWRQTPLKFTSFKAIREHLEKVAHYHLAGFLDQKQLNGQTYIASAIFVALDRERTYEGAPEDDLITVMQESGGKLNLTPEQAAQLMQTPQDEVKVKLIKKFLRDNEVIDAEEVIPREISDLQKEIKEHEEWAFP